MLFYWFILFSVFLNPCGKMLDHLANIDGLSPQHSSLYSTFEFNSLENIGFPFPRRENHLSIGDIPHFFFFLLMSDSDLSDFQPSRWLVNRWRNRKASFSEPFAVFALPDDLLRIAMQPATTIFPNIG